MHGTARRKALWNNRARGAREQAAGGHFAGQGSVHDDRSDAWGVKHRHQAGTVDATAWGLRRSLVADENMIIDMNDAIEQGSGELIGVTEDLSMVIEDGSVTAFGQNAQTFSFADGKLNIPSPDAETPALEQNIELLEDGSIAYTLTGFQIIFTAVTLAE